MKILVINSGSSSLKFQVFEEEGDKLRRLVRGMVERIGIPDSHLQLKTADGRAFQCPVQASDHREAIALAVKHLTDAEHGVLRDIHEIKGVGHRVVHGAEKFIASVVIDEEVIRTTEACCRLAPLHNPPNLLGIRACRSLLPGVPQVAVYDTAFHQTMPPRSYLYGLPLSFAEEHGIRRYGFHGTSHRFVSEQVPGILGRPAEKLKFVTCHLGNGSSLAAVQGGRCVDTSMGLTPLEGVIMGTRCGDMDPAIVLFLQEDLGLAPKEVERILNKESGLLGLCGRSDLRDIEEAAAGGDVKAERALDVFTYRIAKKIGSYAAAMNGLDAVVFTAGIGENSARVRGDVSAYLGFLGAELDPERNERHETVVSTPASKVALLVVPTDEELLIARDTVRRIQGR